MDITYGGSTCTCGEDHSCCVALRSLSRLIRRRINRQPTIFLAKEQLGMDKLPMLTPVRAKKTFKGYPFRGEKKGLCKKENLPYA